MRSLVNHRKVDPIFNDAINQVFIQPDKTAFCMDSSIGVGKSSNFVMQGAYQIAQCVSPITKNGREVRESKWGVIRDSEQSAYNTVIGLLTDAIFSPEIMALDEPPVRHRGSHPIQIFVEHELPDGTYLEMSMQCYGFNNDKSYQRLKTHEFLGAIMFEIQAIPFNVFETMQERCGRYRTDRLTIEKEIDGKVHRLSGLTHLAMVFADINIPKRPHELYTKYYDVADKSSLPYLFIDIPAPILPIPVESVTNPNVLKKYPVNTFEGNQVVWIPNPKAYNLTRHFEERDDDGNNIPYSGYKYWYSRLHNDDSYIRRFVLAKPDKTGGAESIYPNFMYDETTIHSKPLEQNGVVYVGYDPGGYAAMELLQPSPENAIHFFKEFFFTPEDGTGVRQHFKDFLFPYARANLQGFTVIIVPDPNSTALGKNKSVGHTESVLQMMRDEIRMEMEKNSSANVNYVIERCVVPNQDTEARINSLSYFMSKGKLTVDPSCDMLGKGLAGEYKKIKLKSGIISENIDKNKHSHPVEAAQYPVVNILYGIKRNEYKKRKSKTSKVRRLVKKSS